MLVVCLTRLHQEELRCCLLVAYIGCFKVVNFDASFGYFSCSGSLIDVIMFYCVRFSKIACALLDRIVPVGTFGRAVKNGMV